MAITIGTLNAGNMTVTLGGGGSSGHADTWVKFSENDTWHEYEINGAMDCPALISVGLMPEGSGEMGPPEWTTQPYAVEIGTDVTSIGDSAFYYCSRLTSVTIPDSVTRIGYFAFYECSGLTSITFLGKTMEQVQEMDNYDSWGIDPSIINVA